MFPAEWYGSILIVHKSQSLILFVEVRYMYLSLSTKQDRGPLGFLKITRTLYETQDNER